MTDDTKALKDELAAAMADLDEAATFAEINQTLVDMLEVMKQRKPAPEPPAPAPVVVNVSPTPIKVDVAPTPIHFTTPPMDDLVFVHEYDVHGRITETRMTRIARAPTKKAG